MIYDNSMVRFATSGTLIGIFGVVDHLARRRGAAGSKVPAPKWVRPLMFVSIGVFYLLIGPTGGPLFGDVGNAAGIALAVVAFAMRLAGTVRYPDLASRCLFYVALPIAVGVPWGELVLSLPACAASIYCAVRAERLTAGSPAEAVLAPRYRMFYGIW